MSSMYIVVHVLGHLPNINKITPKYSRVTYCIVAAQINESLKGFSKVSYICVNGVDVFP